MNLGQFFFRYIARALLHLRYRVEIHGTEHLKNLKGPAIIAPNHPGLLDPPLIMSYIGGVVLLRPLVIEGMYRHPLLYPFMLLINAFEVPELAQQNQAAKNRTATLIEEVVQELDKGTIFLIYPSGRIERKGYEILGGTRSVPDILQQRPNTKLILVRTSGMWGSLSGFAPTGTDPNLSKEFVRVLGILAAALIFFVPRRKVKIEIEVADLSSLPSLSREHLNPFLENWYNRTLPRDPVYVPYHPFLGPRTITFPPLASNFDVDLEKIEPATKEAVHAIIAERIKRPLTESEKEPTAELEVIGLDSLDRMELALVIEQRFGFQSDKVAVRLADLYALAQGLVESSGPKQISVPEVWSIQPSNPDAFLSNSGETIPEAILRQGLANLSTPIVADDLSGVLTYERFLVGARLMASRFRELPGDSIALMLPASVAADIVLTALMLAGKRPVLLNWTTGPANLAHAVKTMNIQRIVSSKKFIERVGTNDLEKTGVEFTYLEEIRKSISKLEQITTLLRTRFFGAAWLRQIPKLNPNDPAAILFTSGSEKAPKAVPLTHKNILTVATMGSKALGMTRGDILLGFLPPFHSFGISGTMVLPLITGMRVVYHADPTDAAGLVKKIAAYKPTILLTTPTFFSYILSRAKPEELASVRLVITGAEKCPESVFTKAQQMVPHAVISEGYGITECSPVVSVNRPENVRRGSIGHPLETVEALVVDPDTKEPMPRNKRGLLLISGPTVFPGYLNYDGPSPFHERDGKRWYITGDLAMIDDQDFIHFAGRLKRFLKAGGEMISLPALEEPFISLYPTTEDGPQVAVEGIETPTGRKIVLFTTQLLTIGQANEHLSKAGFRGIMRLDEVRQIEKIPVLGTGKTDYKVLRALIT